MPPEEMCVSSQFSNLIRVAEFVAERAHGAGLDDDAVYDLQVAVDEACTNSMEHAYDGREDGVVRVCCYAEGPDFVVAVADQGRPFDPRTVRAPDVSMPIESRGIGGLGLFLMRQLVDSLEFRSGDDGNEVILRKRIKSTP